MNIMVFDRDLVRVADLNWSAVQAPVEIADVDGEMKLQLVYPINEEDSVFLEKGNFIAVPDYELPNEFQAYEIINIQEDNDFVYVDCDHFYVNDLGTGEKVSWNTNDDSADLAIIASLENERWEVGTVEVEARRKRSVSDMNPLESLRYIEQEWGGELRFRVEMQGSGFYKFYVDLLNRRGAFNGVRFEFGHNLMDFKHTVDFTSVVTAMYGRGKGQEVASDTESTAEETKALTFENIEWSVANGDPIDKPLGQDWVGDDTARSLYGRPDGSGGRKHVFATWDSQAETELGLLQETWLKVRENRDPLVNVEATVLALSEISPDFDYERTQLGDDVYVVVRRQNRNVEVLARILKVERDRKSPQNTKYEIGNFMPASYAKTIEKIQKDVNIANARRAIHDRSNVITPEGKVPTSVLEGVIDAVQNEVHSSIGFTYQVPEGILILNDDKDTGNPTKAMLLSGGAMALSNEKDANGEWVWRTFGDGDGFVADELISGSIKTDLIEIFGSANFRWDGNNIYILDPVNSQKQMRIGNYQGSDYGIAFTQDGGATWNVALDYNGFHLNFTEVVGLEDELNTIDGKATEAKSTADSAAGTANTANETANSANQAAQAAQGTANAANATANSAYSKAGTAEEAAGTAKSAADAAQQAANTAQGTANTAKSTADSATAAASAAQSAAEAAQADADAAQGKADQAAQDAADAETAANTANLKLDDLSNDNKLTPVEKQLLKSDWDAIVGEKPTIDAQATTFGITTEKTNYGTAYGTLNTYITPLLADLTTTSDITGTTLRTNFKSYYDKRQVLLKAITDAANKKATDAATAAGNAQSDADTAQGAADAANQAAQAAASAASAAQATANAAKYTAENIILKPAYSKDFLDSDLSTITVSQGTAEVTGEGVMRVTGTGSDVYATFTPPEAIDGGTYELIAIRIRYVGDQSTTQPPTWQGQIYYGTAAEPAPSTYVPHAASENFTYKGIPEPAKDGSWTTLLLDMHKLTTGGTDWKDHDINMVRLDLWSYALYEVQYFTIGTVSTNFATPDDIKFVTEQINSVKISIEPDNITQSVMSTKTFNDALQSKADAESLGNYATIDDLAQVEGAIPSVVDEKVAAIDFSPYVTGSELQQTSDDLTAKFSAGGGVNLLRNSTGISDFDFWTKTGLGVVKIARSTALEQLGFAAGFLFEAGANSRALEQEAFVPPNTFVTLSGFVNKTSATTDAIYVSISELNPATGAYVELNRVTYTAATNGYEKFTMTVAPTSNKVKVYIYAGITPIGTVAGLMLNLGSAAFQWTMANGEVYNTNVGFDLNGIRVSKITDGKEENRTIMTPDKFGGYYDTNNDGVIDTADGSIDEVFKMDEDSFVMKKAVVKEEITMGAIKIIDVDGGGHKGWAFVPIIE